MEVDGVDTPISPGMTLLTLPGELLLQIMEHLRDSQDVQSLTSIACTCKALREVAEMNLYSFADFTTLSSLYLFLDAATRAEPKRRRYLRDLKLLYSTSRYDYEQPPYPPDLTAFPNLTSFVSESPECQPRSVKGTHWKVFMDMYMKAFSQASLLNESGGTPRPLQNLRSVTLHWTDTGPTGRRFWKIPALCPIFLLSQVESLEISCASVGQEPPTELEAQQLDRFRCQTQLKSLVFTECIVSIEALHAILSIPRALKRLVLWEKFSHRIEMGDRFATDESDAFHRAIAQQAPSLEHLDIFHHSQHPESRKTLVLSLSAFPALSHVQLGPFLQSRMHSFNYAVELPVPPALQMLRLNEYAITMLKDHRVDKVFSDLSLNELLRNAEARAVPFTLDISLQHLPKLLLRTPNTNQDIRPLIHRLVKRLGERFRERQGASLRRKPGVNPELLSDTRTHSRLRVLTNKPRRKIPPYLHNEGSPRFLVRYDSSHQQEFPSEPYIADEVIPDRDLSSDDEDMDVAFRDAGWVDPDVIV
ncbi:hypothetical protein F5Y04DRAFT_198183 [Hypomontagnella monticulosa]|nr:hypothetical protein F5Y04DRAFT_198183 [Hypomontagnella monticulosa]